MQQTSPPNAIFFGNNEQRLLRQYAANRSYYQGQLDLINQLGMDDNARQRVMLQIAVLDGKTRGIIELVASGNPGNWEIDETFTFLKRVKE